MLPGMQTITGKETIVLQGQAKLQSDHLEVIHKTKLYRQIQWNLAKPFVTKKFADFHRHALNKTCNGVLQNFAWPVEVFHPPNSVLSRTWISITAFLVKISQILLGCY